MLLLRILTMWLLSQQNRSLAVQLPPYPRDSTVMYCCCAFLWHSFMFISLKHSHRFQVGNFGGRGIIAKLVHYLHYLPVDR